MESTAELQTVAQFKRL